MRKTFCLLLWPVAAFTSLQAQKTYAPTWESIDSRPVPAWFTDAKFGIFIHWGVYSVPAWAPVGAGFSVYSKYAEWYWQRLVSDTTGVGRAFRDFHAKTYGPNATYQDFAPLFKGELFRPEQWADLFAGSGARYVVLTSKHHEGFALWPSKEAWNWNAYDVGPHRDLAGDLAKAVKAKGLRMGFYYSLYEWFNPLYRSDVKAYVAQHMLPQMKELVQTYRPDVLWTDGEWEQPSETWRSTEFLAWLYNESSVKNSVAVNDRWGKETRSRHGGYYTTEYGLVGQDSAGGAGPAHPWEECRGIGGSFGYNRAETLSDYEPSERLVHLLIEKVARGGNLLLDIGPNTDGTIPVIMQQRLLDMGGWLKTNGDAVYGTVPWAKAPALKKETTLFFTQKGADLYLISTVFPKEEISVGNLHGAKSVRLLGSGAVVPFTFKNGTCRINASSVRLAGEKLNYAWVFKIEGAVR